MKTYLVVALAVSLMVSVLLSCSLPVNGEEGSEVRRQLELKLPDGELKTNRFKELGISVILPRNAMNVEAWGQKWYVQDTGRKKLDFVLGKISPGFIPGLEEMRIWRGYVNIFTQEQYEDWRKAGTENMEWTENTKPAAEILDQIRTQLRPQQYLGYVQKTFRMDRRAPDGRVLQAFIIRCEYTTNSANIQRDYLLITNILQSVRFLE